jgi:hypothetical protein
MKFQHVIYQLIKYTSGEMFNNKKTGNNIVFQNTIPKYVLIISDKKMRGCKVNLYYLLLIASVDS